MADRLLSIGILSVDLTRYASRRSEQRSSWVGVAHAHAPLVLARFVMRCGSWTMSPEYSPSNYTPSAELLAENATHSDLLCTDVPENAGRLKGPSLLVLAWFSHASRLQPRSRFIACADDDAYLHLAPMGILDLLHRLPRGSCGQGGGTDAQRCDGSIGSSREKNEDEYIYVGAMHGWSINHTSFVFRNFGWDGCGAGCDGPFPFATGSLMCVSHALAREVVSATAGAELATVYSLSPHHKLFFHDPFLGQAIYRLVPSGSRLPRLDVYNLDPWAQDTDGFRVAPSLLIWHNRHKMPCRVLCLGEYYREHACGAAHTQYEWVVRRSKGRVDMSRYLMWDARFKTAADKPNKEPRPGERVLAGEAAQANQSCHSVVDLRDPRTIAALNLSTCAACHQVVLAARSG